VTIASAAASELQALRCECAAYHLERVLISLGGRDRVRWLNGMVSNNIRDLEVGRGVYAFVLNPQGHIQGDLYAFNRGESITLELERPQAQTVLQILRRYIIMDKVEIEDLSERLAVIGVSGPNSPDVLGKIGLQGSELAPLQLADVNWNGSAVTLLRGDNPCMPSFELWVEKEQAESLWKGLHEAGAPEADDAAVETLRIICGVPKFGVDIRERTLPQETGQERALSFTKGCYIGQEIVERIRARGAVHRMFTGFEVQGPAALAGTKIQSDGKDVGEITSVASARVDGEERILALGFVRKEALASGSGLTAGEANLKATSLPFNIQ